MVSRTPQGKNTCFSLRGAQTRARLNRLGADIRQQYQQLERLTEAYLSDIIPLPEYQRRRTELARRQAALTQQAQQLQEHVRQQTQVAQLTASLTDFCQRTQAGLQSATFEQQRQWVELLIDRVVVMGEQVEIRYVIPIGPAGETIRFCHLRSDYFGALDLQLPDLLVKLRFDSLIVCGGPLTPR